MGRAGLLLGWNLLFLLVPTLALALAPNWTGDKLARLLLRLPYPHGIVKWGLESSQGLLLRQDQLPWGLLGTGLLALLVLARPRAWVAGLAGVACLTLWTPHYSLLSSLGLLALVALGWMPEGWLQRLPSPLRALAWLPGALLLFPRLLLSRPSGPWARRLALGWTPIASGALFLLCSWADVLLNYERVRDDLERWPLELLDPRITRLATSPPGLRADWHGVRILGEHAIVSSETDPRLSAMSLRSERIVEYPLRPRWGVEFAGPLEAEVDPQTGTVWTVDGGDSLLSLRWDGERWTPLARAELPVTVSYASLGRAGDQLLLTTIQAIDRGPRRVLRIPIPSMAPIQALAIRRGEQRGPMPREATWVPPLDRQIIAPDFGSQLFTVDLQTGEAEPWLDVPSLNGKMVWLEQEQRLLLALPNRVEAWLVDPLDPRRREAIPTQPGVRALAVDSERGLLVTASVLTGQIWVQSLADGEVLLRMGTVMPMVREMALSPELGIGVLTTWHDVYRFDYLP
mgnify:CR=1 FL=1